MSSRKYKINNKLNASIRYTILVVVGFLMIYPLLWLLSSSFKGDNESIFLDPSLYPSNFTVSSYIEGWKTKTEYSYTTFYINSFMFVIIKSICTVISSVLVAYGFARFTFPFKNILFSILLGTMFLPFIVALIPQYLMFVRFGWIDTYLPLIVPAAFATQGFFVFLLVQFLRGIPREMEEAAQMDGANSLRILISVVIPILKPAIVSITVFSFIWTMSDFFGPLVYISSVNKYPVSLALKMSVDIAENTPWNEMFAMSMLSLVPSIIVFIFAQRYFTDTIVISGTKG